MTDTRTDTRTDVRTRQRTGRRAPPHGAGPRPPAVTPRVRWLTGLLAVTTTAVALPTVLDRDLLAGPAVMNGSARGTALVMLVAAGLLAVVTGYAARGSLRAVVVQTGLAAFLTYNAVMLLLATPANSLYLGYIALLGLALFGTAAIVRDAPLRALDRAVGPKMPRRALVVTVWVVAGLNALAWLGRIVPATLTGDVPDLADGTGLTTVPTYVQDLAVWLPLAVLGAGWFWRHRPLGTLAVGATLTMWVAESATIAVDQWFGHRADPGSAVASAAAVPAFAVAAVLMALALGVFLRHVREHRPLARSREGRP